MRQVRKVKYQKNPAKPCLACDAQAKRAFVAGSWVQYTCKACGSKWCRYKKIVEYQAHGEWVHVPKGTLLVLASEEL